VREYIWLDDMPVAMIDDAAGTPQVYFIHADHLDRPVMMTDASKTVSYDAVFRPFGELQSLPVNAATINLRFPGQYQLTETGLAHNWHRQYDASIGRYIQPDPLGFVDGPSVYAYARSSPQMEIDPEGTQLVIPRPGPGVPFPYPKPFDEWNKQGAQGLWDWMLKVCRQIAGNGGGNQNNNRCLDRWEKEYARCEKFRPFGYRYQLGCQARANDRLRLCNRNGGKPDPSEPPEYDWRDIPRDPAER
jgi:RHS repeat-associated protein